MAENPNDQQLNISGLFEPGNNGENSNTRSLPLGTPQNTAIKQEGVVIPPKQGDDEDYGSGDSYLETRAYTRVLNRVNSIYLLKYRIFNEIHLYCKSQNVLYSTPLSNMVLLHEDINTDRVSKRYNQTILKDAKNTLIKSFQYGMPEQDRTVYDNYLTVYENLEKEIIKSKQEIEECNDANNVEQLKMKHNQLKKKRDYLDSTVSAIKAFENKGGKRRRIIKRKK